MDRIVKPFVAILVLASIILVWIGVITRSTCYWTLFGGLAFFGISSCVSGCRQKSRGDVIAGLGMLSIAASLLAPRLDEPWFQALLLLSGGALLLWGSLMRREELPRNESDSA